jgi:V/A-type H+/Na+-transporting ATPase subunit I
MIFPEKMVRLTVAGPKSVLERVIKELYSLKIMHIVDHTKGEIDIGIPLQRADELSGLLVDVRALKDKLVTSEKGTSQFKAIAVKNFRDLASTIHRAKEEVAEKEREISSATDELKSTESRECILAQLSELRIPLEAYRPYRSLSCFVGTLQNAKDLSRKISSITDKAELRISTSQSDRKTIALFIYKEHSNEALELLQSEGFCEIDLSPLEGLKGMPSELLYALHEKQAALRKRISAAKLALSRLGPKWRDFLLVSEDFLSMELEKAEAPLKFASTKNVFVVTGWIPENKAGFAKDQLLKAGNEKISIDVSHPEEHDTVPAMLNNPKPTKPFEFFLGLYDMPQHIEIDPTTIMAITFPILFGFILGDFGYGIVLLGLFILLMKKMPSVRNLASIMAVSSVSSIIFGLIFGEFFGAEALFGHELPRLLSRTEGIMELMYVAIAVGLVQLNLGFALGFVNVFKVHGFKHAFFEKGSWIVLEIGIALIALSAMKVLALPMYVGYIVLALSIVMLWMGEGIRGIVEMPGFFGNVFSYARLMAVGVASVQLALVINEIAEGMFHSGGFMIIAAVLVLVAGHGINIALGILGGFLHATRLHYVEFFGKFFKGGGTSYHPFGEK